MLLSVAVLCHDEERVPPELVAQVTAALRSVPLEPEIVPVDGGGRDRTAEVLRELHAVDRRVRYVSSSRNFGRRATSPQGGPGGAPDAGDPRSYR